jgi:hypothetical protein
MRVAVFSKTQKPEGGLGTGGAIPNLGQNQSVITSNP